MQLCAGPSKSATKSSASTGSTLRRLVLLLLAAILTSWTNCPVRAEIVPVELRNSVVDISGGDSRSLEVSEEGETIVKDFMICRLCGTDISISNFLLAKRSPAATQLGNVTLYGSTGVLIQDLHNALGGSFRVVVVRRAQCAQLDGWRDSHTWFPGFAWKPCLCPRCSAHLGWMFEPLETATAAQQLPTDGQGFYVLIVHNVLSETFVNSLIATNWDLPAPKSSPQQTQTQN